MKKTFFALLAAAALPLTGEEVKAPVTGAMVFKNGVSAVRRTVQPGKQTAFELADTIEPMQGSLWFTDPVFSVVRKNGKKPVSGKYSLDNITKTFAGQPVVLTVSSGNNTVKEIAGTIWDPAPGAAEREESFDKVWLKLANGQFLMLNQHNIQSVQVQGQPKAVALPEQFDKRPVWAFTLSRMAEKPIFIDYLTQGLAWQSAYRLELGRENKMHIAMDAEIVNNLADMEKADLFLASGHANFSKFGAKSPMSMIQPGKQDGVPMVEAAAPARYGRSRSLMKSKHWGNDAAAAPAADFGEASTGETEDISLLHLAGFTLKKGEVCHRVLDRAEGTFERLVHWQIPAWRNADTGRVYHSGDPEPMDALRFQNPFDRPITASPLEILDGGMVLAQVQIPWVNRGDKAIVDITRALTVTGKVVEYEVAPQDTARAEQVFDSVVRNKQGAIVSGTLAGRSYRVTDVQGELRLKNHRQKAARILIKLNYAGTLVAADGNPENAMLGRGISINPLACLTWELELPGNAEKVLKYRYNVFFH